jgi:regulatory protein
VRYVSEPTPGSPADLQQEADPEQAARTILLRRLTAAPRARAELRSDLVRRGIPPDVADRVLDRFTDVGLIDDEAYAQAWVESRQRTRGTARAVLRQELRGKGVGDEDVQAALEGIDDVAERARAVELVRVKVRAMQRLDDDVKMRRLVSMLMRRGYRQGVALSVVTEVLGDGPDGHQDHPD